MIETQQGGQPDSVALGATKTTQRVLSASPASVGPITIEPPDDGPKSQSVPLLQENARQRLMVYLVSILTIEVVFALTITWIPGLFGKQNISVDDLKEIMIIIFGPTVALVGTAAGFYFGSDRHNSRN